LDPAWLTDVLLVEVECVPVDGVDVVFGATEFTVLVTVCVTFCTVDWTGLVVDVVVAGLGTGAGAVVGVVVGTGDVAAPAGMKPATDPAASINPDVTTPAVTSRRFRLIYPLLGCGGCTDPLLSPQRRVLYP
jgi:hypothetical protein